MLNQGAANVAVTARGGIAMIVTSQSDLTPEELKDIERLSAAELEIIVQHLCEAPVPLSPTERRQVVVQYLVDGGSLANLRM